MPLIEVAKIHNGVKILDTRSEQEFNVSHIPDAHWVGFKEFNTDKVKTFHLKIP